MSARFEAVGGGGEESQVGFFCGRELRLRGGKTGRIGDDEVEQHAFGFGMFEPFEHIGALEDVFGVCDARIVGVEVIVFSDEIEGMPVAVETPDGLCGADGGIDGEAAGVAADIEDFFIGGEATDELPVESLIEEEASFLSAEDLSAEFGAMFEEIGVGCIV